MEKTFKEKLELYREEANKYFSELGICPVAEDILDYVCGSVEEEIGISVDKEKENQIVKILGLEI